MYEEDRKVIYSCFVSTAYLAFSLLLRIIFVSVLIYQPLERDVYESRPQTHAESVTLYALKDNRLHLVILISQIPIVECSKGYLFQDATLIIENRTQCPPVVYTSLAVTVRAFKVRCRFNSDKSSDPM